MRIFILLNLFIILFLSNAKVANAYQVTTFQPTMGYQNNNNTNGFCDIENNIDNEGTFLFVYFAKQY